MNNSKTEKLRDKYLAEMHRIVGAKFDIEECKKEDWFRKHKWTREQELDFKAWLVGELIKDLKITRKRAIREAEMFLLNWGWRTDD
jgi:hypothetical protein